MTFGRTTRYFCVVVILGCLAAALVGCTSGEFATLLAPEPVVPKFVYVANGSGDSVTGFVIDNTTGALTAIAGSPFTVGTGPWGVAVDHSGKFLYVTNQFDFTISAFSIDANGGTLTPIPGSPFASPNYPTGATTDAAGFLYVANGAQNVSAFKINASTGALTPVSGSPYPTGISHFALIPAVDPGGRFLYATTQIGDGVSAFKIDATGALTPVVGSPFSAGVLPVGVAVDTTGQFAYVTASFDAGVGRVHAFRIDAATGALTELSASPVTAGVEPSVAAISGTNLYVANSTSNDVSAFAIDSTTGALTPVVGTPFPAGNRPAGVAADPSGRFVYVANFADDTLSAYTIGSSGKLTAIAGGPYATGSHPISVTVARKQ